MKLKLKRRSVYIATIVAIFAMAGGFALATFPGGFSGFGGTSSNQNSGTFVGGNTIWSNGASVTLVQAAAPTACDTVAYATTAATVYLDGSYTCANGMSSAVNQWYEDFTFTTPSEANGLADNFAWYVVGGPTPAGQLFTVSGSVTYTGTVTLNVYFDMGPASANPLTLTSISATVSGS
jgi:hypothetical protein